MNLNEYSNKFLSVINEEIRKNIPKDSFSNLYDAMFYVFETGGKRLRSILCLAVCESLGGDTEDALPFAVAIEIAHNALLVHDDMEDGDIIRRGKPSIWIKYGIPHGMNIGDGMYFKAYESFINAKKLPAQKVVKLSEIFTETLMRIIEGQNMEFNFRARDDVTAEEYEEMVWRKSGTLITASLIGAATIAEAPDKVIKVLKEYGRKIGIAFQIKDDILNLIGDQEKYGKEIGGDIKEGKKTLVMIHCLSHCDKNERKKLLEILKKSRKAVTKDDVKLAMVLVKKYGSIEFAGGHSTELIQKAKQLLTKIDNVKLKNILEEFADFMVKREF